MERWKEAGRMKARRVQQVAPIRLISTAKLGTAIATTPVSATSASLIRFCSEGRRLAALGSSLLGMSHSVYTMGQFNSLP